MATKKPTQADVVMRYILTGLPINGSLAYKLTKLKCKCGTMNLHKRITQCEEFGLVIKREWHSNKSGRYMKYQLDTKATSKLAIKAANKYLAGRL